MSKKNYEVIGIPIGAPFTVLQDKRVGDVFEYEDLDKDIEKLLTGAGSLRVLPAKEAREIVKERGESQVQSKEDPQPQVAPAASEPIEERVPEEAVKPRKEEPPKEVSPEPASARTPEEAKQHRTQVEDRATGKPRKSDQTGDKAQGVQRK